MFGDIGKMMKLAGQMKAKMPEMQAKLENSTYVAEAGGGAVQATVNGRLGVVDIKIDGAAWADGEMDRELLEDLIKAAVSAAQQKATAAAAEAMRELTGGMDLPGLSGMMGM